MSHHSKQPPADHVTEPPACAETARVTGPLAGGAADAHPSGPFLPLADQDDLDNHQPESHGLEAIAMIFGLIGVMLIIAVLLKIYLAI